MDLDEVLDPPADLVAQGPVGRDRRRDGHDVVAREQCRHEADAADVRVAVFLGEAEPLREVLTHLVAVEQLDSPATGPQPRTDQLRDRALSGDRQSGEPQAATRRIHGGAHYGNTHGNRAVARPVEQGSDPLAWDTGLLDDDLSGPRDACGVIGVYAPGQPVANLTYLGL